MECHTARPSLTRPIEFQPAVHEKSEHPHLKTKQKSPEQVFCASKQYNLRRRLTCRCRTYSHYGYQLKLCGRSTGAVQWFFRELAAESHPLFWHTPSKTARCPKLFDWECAKKSDFRGLWISIFISNCHLTTINATWNEFQENSKPIIASFLVLASKMHIIWTLIKTNAIFSFKAKDS